MREIVTPKLCVDAVVLTGGGVLLIRRANPPFQGGLALPGGFVDVGETVERACLRELEEETGLRLPEPALRLVGVYSDPRRDERFHSVAVAFTARAEATGLRAGDDAAAVEIVADWQDRPIAFDHRQIIADAMRLWEG